MLALCQHRGAVGESDDVLLRYCEDGELSIDNNASERAMKMPALGRKNWLFVASKGANGTWPAPQKLIHVV